MLLHKKVQADACGEHRTYDTVPHSRIDSLSTEWAWPFRSQAVSFGTAHFKGSLNQWKRVFVLGLDMMLNVPFLAPLKTKQTVIDAFLLHIGSGCDV